MSLAILVFCFAAFYSVCAFQAFREYTERTPAPPTQTGAER